MAQEEAQLSRLQSLAASFAAADPACLLLLEEALDNLLSITKSPEGRKALASHGAVSRLLELVPLLGSHLPQLRRLWVTEAGQLAKQEIGAVGGFVLRPLLLLLRVLRNLCAGEKANQDAFLNGGVQITVQLALAFGQVSASERDPLDVVRAAIQTLGNAAGAGEEHQAAIWAACFPDAFCQLAKLHLHDIQGPLCMLLFRCCRESETRRAEFCGHSALLRLLFSAAHRDEGDVSDGGGASVNRLQTPLSHLSDPAIALPSGHAPVRAPKGPMGPASVNTLHATATPSSTSEAVLPSSQFTLPANTDPSTSERSASLRNTRFESQQSFVTPPSPFLQNPHTAAASVGAETEPIPEPPRFGGGEWLHILVDLLCLQHPLLPEFFEALSGKSNGHGHGDDTGGSGVAELTLEEENGVREFAAGGFTVEQAALLQTTLNALSLRSDADEGSGSFPFPSPSAAFLLRLSKAAARCAAAHARFSAAEKLGSSPSEGRINAASSSMSQKDTFVSEVTELSRGEANEGSGQETATRNKVSNSPSKSRLPPAIPTGHPTVNVLGLSLRLLSSVCATRVVSQSKRGDDVMSALLTGGLVPVLLDMLRALGLPERLRRKGGEENRETEAAGETVENKMDLGSSQREGFVMPLEAAAKQNEEERGTSSSGGSDETAAGPTPSPPVSPKTSIPISSRLPRAFPSRSPYLGYRRDVVAVLANAAHRNPPVQNAVRERGGLLLVLQQCVVEESSPFLREWALFAVRNLCEGNQRNQDEIAALEIRAAANTAETEAMGYRVEVDSKSGRPKLVNIAAKEV